MKKLLLLSIISFSVLNPFTAFGQKKGKKDKKNKNKTEEVIVLPVIQNEADSLSYALGLNITQGLSNYLTQLEVLTDTVGVEGTKLDSIRTKNAQNLSVFLDGFKVGMKADSDNKSYNTGLSVATQVSSMIQGFSKDILGDEASFNQAAFVSAFVGSLNKETPLINIEDPNAMIQQKAQDMQQVKELRAQEETKAKYADKIAAEAKFMEENKAKEGVVVRESGLQYKVLKEGSGRVPTVNERVKVHYHGTLLDGSVFDSSVERGEPVEFSVGQLIRGFNEALMLMPEGSKWIVYIPYDLAYGAANQGKIEPFSDLIFEIELLEVEPQSAQ